MPQALSLFFWLLCLHQWVWDWSDCFGYGVGNIGFGLRLYSSGFYPLYSAFGFGLPIPLVGFGLGSCTVQLISILLVTSVGTNQGSIILQKVTTESLLLAFFG